VRRITLGVPERIHHPHVGKKVLVVDDEEDVRDFLRIVLEASGYEVECVGDGVEALHGIDAWSPDLVLVDLMMPVMDGWEILSRRAGRGAPRLIVVPPPSTRPRRDPREPVRA
jgi:CheY-like chemotaxis protein